MVEPGNVERASPTKNKAADGVTRPPVVLRMPDMTQTEPAWEPVIRPIRYKLILAGLALCALLMVICYWILKAEISPLPEEAPPWDGNRWNNSEPVKVERPTDGRISTHQPVPTWTVTRLPATTPEKLPPTADESQAGGEPRASIRGVMPLGETCEETPSSGDPGVAHLEHRIDIPQTKPDHERARPGLY